MTTTNKGLIQPANGSYVDTWDQPVNNDWSYIDAAFGGVTSLNATGVSAVTLTLTQYQPMAIAISGAMSNNVTYTIPSGVGGNWIVRNTTTDATGGPWTVTFASGGGGSTVTVIRSVNSNIWSDGTNMYFSDSRPAAAAGSNTQVQYNSSGFLSGANVYYIDTSGNVGIGTSSPTSKLQVNGGVTINAGSAPTSGVGMELSWDGTESVVQSYNRNTSSFQPLWLEAGSYTRFGMNGGEAMRIDSSGNVGIGTSSPGTKLDVNGNVYLRGTTFLGSSVTQNIAADSTTLYLRGTAFAFQDAGASSTKMYLDTSGNVGIGTGSPSQKLQVEGTIYSTSGGFKFPDNTTQTTAATATAPATGIGNLYTYALLQYIGGAIAAGTNVTSNGSNLVYVDTAGVGSQYIPAGQIWQAMGYGNAPTLFQRTT